MILGGLQPCSFSDFPGRTAAVIFTQGCNFRCPFCHNGSLLAEKDSGVLSEQEWWQFLDKRKHCLDGVVISGGEPTLHPDLPDFIRCIRKRGVAVKLDTNGSHPEVIAALLESRLLDYIAMDIKAPLAKYDILCGVPVDTEKIRTSMACIAASEVAHHFRTTEVMPLLSKHDLQTIHHLVPAGSPHRFQPFMTENALAREQCETVG